MKIPSAGQRLSILFGLTAITLACFWPVTHHDFVNVDDPQYVVDNPHVNQGVTLEGVKWAFSHVYASNWHPLTWISHMVDCDLFALSPGGHHLVNLIFHVANALLLFVFLAGSTKALWRSAFVAALFAWHPLHVESVAWIAERKDVLSTFFGLAALIAYLRFTQCDPRSEPDRHSGARAGWYAFALMLFACGLMSKPMLVTLPAVLLLLDYWPLNRWNQFAGHRSRLWLEKVPFLLMAAGASAATFWAQNAGGAVSSLSTVPLWSRIANSLVSYVRYLGLTLWPSGLAPIYPYMDHWPLGLVLGAGVFLTLVSWWIWSQRRARSWLFTGWFWFVGTLVPVIGLIQVGPQALADRYTYLPAVGLFIALSWSVAEWIEGHKSRVLVGAAGSLAVLAACAIVTIHQVGFWKNGERLYRRAILVTRDNYVAWDYFGNALQIQGRQDEAFAAMTRSAQLAPHYSEAHYNLGIMLLHRGRYAEAVDHLSRAASLPPNPSAFHQGLGKAYWELGRAQEAEEQLVKAVGLAPTDVTGLQSLGTILLGRGKPAAALEVFEKAARLQSGIPEVERNLGVALAQLGRIPEAISHFQVAVRLAPTQPDYRFNLGLALADSGRTVDAIAQFQKQVRLRPNDTRGHFRLARALAKQGELDAAANAYRDALRLGPVFPEAQSELAWILATAPQNTLRDAPEAVRLAEQAVTNSPSREIRIEAQLSLAAALSASARWSEAVQAARKALVDAEETGQSNVTARATEVLSAAQAGVAFREP